MEQAYDLKDLAKKLEDAGLPEAEKFAEAAYLAVKEWLKESAKVSLNPFDNMVIPFVDQLDSIILPQLDKIDGKEG